MFLILPFSSSSVVPIRFVPIFYGCCRLVNGEPKELNLLDFFKVSEPPLY